jgi:hypothetical protein
VVGFGDAGDMLAVRTAVKGGFNRGSNGATATSAAGAGFMSAVSTAIRSGHSSAAPTSVAAERRCTGISSGSWPACGGETFNAASAGCARLTFPGNPSGAEIAVSLARQLDRCNSAPLATAVTAMADAAPVRSHFDLERRRSGGDFAILGSVSEFDTRSPVVRLGGVASKAENHAL